MKSIASTLVKQRKVPYRKPEAVKQLEAMAMDRARCKYPNVPHLAPRTFRDDTANGLTKCIISYINLLGGFATRINSTGSYRPELRRFVKGSSKRGIADIMATYKGLALHIEVKVGRDVQSVQQKQVQHEVERSGGAYYIARNFTNFKEWIENLL